MPKRVFFSELQEGKRDRGKRYKDQLKRQLAQAPIRYQSWQQEASDRDRWRSSVRKASCKFEAERHKAEKERRRRQTERATTYYPQSKPSSVQSAVGCAHHESISTASIEHARTDYQPSQKCSSPRNQPSHIRSLMLENNAEINFVVLQLVTSPRRFRQTLAIEPTIAGGGGGGGGGGLGVGGGRSKLIRVGANWRYKRLTKQH